MKPGNQLLSEQEAVAASGVSLSTLLRFAEAGYLQLQGTTDDGSKRFSEEQLKGLFGSLSGSKNPVEPPLTKVVDIELKGTPADAGAEEVQAEEPTIEVEEIAAEADELSAAEPLAIETSVSEPTTTSSETPTLPAEHLKTILNLQEQLLAAKEKALSDLETQCKWLQERIERLELKSERDQLLILSETQTLTKLLTATTEKRSTGRKFLEWIGIAQPTATATGVTIDISEGKE
jgi:hypothetical protein